MMETSPMAHPCLSATIGSGRAAKIDELIWADLSDAQVIEYTCNIQMASMLL
jgi:hypothetical protein